MMNITDIRKSFGKRQVLKGCSFHAAPGECIGIVGANGSGKSTLLSIIAGMRRADSGSIETAIPTSSIAYIPQENPIFPELSVRDNLMLWYCDAKTSLDEAATTGVVHMLELSQLLSQKASTLSGGMKKRLSIAMAMAGNPDVIILDEPGAALDLPSKVAIRDYLQERLKLGNTIILATHDEMELELCHKLYVLGAGSLHKIHHTTRGDELLKAINTFI